MTVYGIVLIAVVASSVAQTSHPAFSAPRSNGYGRNVFLTVPAGTPLHLYLTKQVPKKPGTPVQAKLMAPVFAFDRQVIPAGTEVFGQVGRVEPVAKSQRVRAILGGDFTPLRRAHVEFTTMVMPDGKTLALHTVESAGLNSLIPLSPPKQQSGNSSGTGGVLETGKQMVYGEVNSQIANFRSIPSIMRGPGKKERLYDFLMSKLPYHPQYVGNRTRFDAELSEPLEFGAGNVTRESLVMLGSLPPAGCMAHARLVTPLGSDSSKLGEAVQAVLTEPLFTPDHKLLLPEGTRVDGAVLFARKARWFRRSGQLILDLQALDMSATLARLEHEPAEQVLPEPVAALPAAPLELRQQTQAMLDSAEGGGQSYAPRRTITPSVTSSMKLVVKATRYGAEWSGAHQVSTGARLACRLFDDRGLLGVIASEASSSVGTAFGYYGMAWALYSNVIARGEEVEFGKHATIDIRFNTSALNATTGSTRIGLAQAAILSAGLE